MSFALKIVKWSLAILLGALFIFAGANKLTPRIDAAQHAQLSKGFEGFVKAWPFNLTGFSAEAFRVLVGATEVAFGLLVLCPHYTRLSSFVFISLMAGATYMHIALAQPFTVSAVVLAVSILLFLVSGDSVSSSKAAASGKKKQ